METSQAPSATRPPRAYGGASAPGSADWSSTGSGWDGIRSWQLLVIGVAAYLLVLLATVPARYVLLSDRRFALAEGTIWDGGATLASGETLAWTWAPLRSIAGLGFAADWTLDGSGTRLGGKAVIRPSSLALADVTGRAEAGLLGTLLPQLPFSCTTQLDIDLRRAAFGGERPMIAGDVRSEAGSCRPRHPGAGTAETMLPALLFHADVTGGRTEGTLRLIGHRRQLLATLQTSGNGKLVLEVNRDGLKLLPLPALVSAPLRIEF